LLDIIVWKRRPVKETSAPARRRRGVVVLRRRAEERRLTALITLKFAAFQPKKFCVKFGEQLRVIGRPPPRRVMESPAK
jgi:hypothetical protein